MPESIPPYSAASRPVFFPRMTIMRPVAFDSLPEHVRGIVASFEQSCEPTMCLLVSTLTRLPPYSTVAVLSTGSVVWAIVGTATSRRAAPTYDVLLPGSRLVAPVEGTSALAAGASILERILAGVPTPVKPLSFDDAFANGWAARGGYDDDDGFDDALAIARAAHGLS